MVAREETTTVVAIEALVETITVVATGVGIGRGEISIPDLVPAEVVTEMAVGDGDR